MLLGQTISVLGAPYFPAWSADGKQLLIPMQAPDAIALVDVAGKNQIAYRAFSADECKLPHVATLLPDGTYGLTCEGDHIGKGKVLWLDPVTLETIHSRDVGVYPDALFFYRKSSP